MKRYVQTAVAALLTLALAVMAVTVSVTRQEGDIEDRTIESSDAAGIEANGAAEQGKDPEAEAAEGDNGVTGEAQDAESALYATVLGDSIAKGYSGESEADLVPYGSLAMEEISVGEGCPYEIVNYARNGLDSSGMNEKILTKEEVRDSLAKSDIIFITVGSNDLLNECKRMVQEILNTDTKFKSADEALQVLEDSVKKNPFLVVNIIGALGNWDYQSFEANWIDMMDSIRSLDSMEGGECRIIVTNIYNPVANLKLPSTMNQVVEDIISNMNTIISDHAEEYGYSVSDLFGSNVSAYVQSDGLHPNQEGQQIIAELVCGKYEEMGAEE